MPAGMRLTSPPRRRVRPRGLAVCGLMAGAMLAAQACRDGTGADGPRAPSALVLQFGDSLIELGTSRLVFSLVRAEDGAGIYDVRFRWRSDDTTVARVDAAGRVVATGLGRTRVVAEVRRDTSAAAPPLLTGSVLVRVVPRTVRRVMLDRDTVTIAQEGTVALVGVPEADDRTPLPERPVAWRSLAPDVAEVDGQGVVTGRSPGRAGIVASAAGFADTTWVQVSTFVGGVTAIELPPFADTLALGSRWPLTATVRGPNGVVLTDRVVSWSLRTVRGLDVGAFAGRDTLLATRRGVLEVVASSEGRRASRLLVVDEPFVRDVAPVILRPLDLPGLQYDDTVRVLVTSNTLVSLERLELFLDYRPVAVTETVLSGMSAPRAWVAVIKLEAWPFGPLRLEAIGTDAAGRRGITALTFLRIPAEPAGGPLPGGGRR